MSSERRTAADFLALIVNPVLVMMMVGSLVFLLQESFYRGDFPLRLRWVGGLFVFAAVLIAWITIEMGRTRAGLYLSPLLILGVIALDRFVESHIGGIPALTTVFHVVIVVSVWLVCHHLMLDCLLLDEGAASSGGRGLLEEWSQQAAPQKPDAKKDGSQDGSERTLAGERENRALSVVFNRVYPDRPQGPPGRTVLYVLLGGLLVIAVAGLNGPAQRAVIYAASYVVAGVGLLMTTSLLQLRLYLRERNLTMPGDAVRGWVAVGGAVIVGVLLLGWLLPKPAVPMWSWGVYLTSPLRKASSLASRTMEPANTPSSKGPAAGDSRSPSGKEASGGTADNTQSTAQPSGGGKGTNGKNGGKAEAETSGKQGGGEGSPQTESEKASNKSSGGESPAGKDGGAEKDGGKAGASQASSSESSSDPDASPGEKGPPSSRSPDASVRSEGGPSQGPQEQGPQEQEGQTGSRDAEQTRPGASGSETEPAQESQTDSAESQTDSAAESTGKTWHQSLPRVSLTQVASGLASLFRLLITLGFLAAVAWLAWRYRHEIGEVLRQWWEQLSRLLESLFGRRRVASREEPSPLGASPKAPPFASFQDPFASGMAARRSPVWLVVYSFDALQAWGEGLGVPRDPEETPKEYARRVRASDLGGPAAFDRLCELYNLVAYAGRSGTLTLSAEDRHALAAAWRYMNRRTQEPAAAGGQATAD